MPTSSKPDAKGRESVRKFVQRDYDRHVWRAMLTVAQNWRSGVFVDHVNKRVADRFDFELEPPAFLDDLIAHIESIEPGKED